MNLVGGMGCMKSDDATVDDQFAQDVTRPALIKKSHKKPICIITRSSMFNDAAGMGENTLFALYGKRQELAKDENYKAKNMTLYWRVPIYLQPGGFQTWCVVTHA